MGGAGDDDGGAVGDGGASAAAAAALSAGRVPTYSISLSSSSDASVKSTTVLITREPTALAQGSDTESAHRATRLSTGA